jgi:signal transduction histidine kinase
MDKSNIPETMSLTTFLKPKSTDPDEYRKELILNVILGFCFLMISLFLLMVINNDLQGQSYIGLLYFLLMISPIVLSYRLSRSGHIHIASIILIALFSFGLLYSAYSWGVILPTVLLGIAFIATCTSLLINSRAGFIYAIVSSGIIFIIQMMKEYGLHSPDYSWALSPPGMMDIVEYAILILFISGISWLSNRQTESALVRARASERDLSIERDNLELKVIERTKALEYAQIEKTTEMYRFVEFGKLSAGLIHDLMSPLTALCIENESTKTGLAETSATLIGASRKIQDIIHATRNQIKAEFTSERISISDTIDETLLLHQSRIKKLNISVRKSIPVSLYIDGSPSLLSHILTNLISNAIDALEARKSESPLILEIYAIRQPTYIKIIVRDNGIGFPEEIKESIFDPFFTTKKHTGWGYGLSASRHIVQKYFGGSISAESKGGKTSFIVILPFGQPSR